MAILDKKKKNKFTLALFFTRGVSLKVWVEKGLFDREKLIYEEHLKRGNLQKVYWITYGSEDKEIANRLKRDGELHKNIEILPMPGIFDSKLGKIVYSFLIPIVYGKILRRVDILKTNQMDGSWSAVLAKLIYKKALIVRTGFTWSQLERKLRRKSKIALWIIKLIEGLSYKYADIAIVASKHNKDYVCKNYHPKRIEVIYNYVDITLFKPMTNMKKYDDRIIYVGRLSNEKNLFNLVRAFTTLPITLDVYGSGKLEEKLKNEARKLRVKVNFSGVIPNHDLPKVLNKYKYFVLPSYYEGMPKSLLEALACGLLCIGTNVDGIRDIIKDEENGILIFGTSSEEIKKSVLRALKMDHDKYISITRKAVKDVQQKFSVEKIIKKELAIMQSITS